MSCNRSEQVGKNVNRDLIKIENRITKDNVGDEVFYSFFEFFKKDTLFQMERTTIPFVSSVFLATVNAAGDMKADIVMSSDKSEWRFAYWVSTTPQKIEIKEDSAIIIFIDSVYVREFSTSPIFVKTDRKWYLKTLEVKQLPLR